MQVQVFARGDSGVLTTTLLAELEPKLTTDGVTFRKAALWNDLDATIKLTGDIDEAYTAANDWLGARILIYAPDATQLWNGYIRSVSFGSGGRKRTRSLDGYANRARLVYDEINAAVTPPTVTTAAKVITVDDTAGQSLYGIMEYTAKPGQLVAAQATARNARDLADRQRLFYAPDSSGTIGGSQAESGNIITLGCSGFWRVLMDKAYVVATTGTADVATIIGAILTANVSTSILPADHSQLQTTGVTAAQQYSAYDSGGAIIKQLVASAAGYTFGIATVGRFVYLRPDNKLNTTPDYTELSNGMLLDTSGAPVDLWTVQPDTLLRQADMLPLQTTAAAVDSVDTVYLSEITYQSPGRLSYRASVPGLNGAINSL